MGTVMTRGQYYGEAVNVDYVFASNKKYKHADAFEIRYHRNFQLWLDTLISEITR